MLEKYLNKNVKIYVSSHNELLDVKKGIITGINDNFVELDNNELIGINFIRNIKIA